MAPNYVLQLGLFRAAVKSAIRFQTRTTFGQKLRTGLNASSAHSDRPMWWLYWPSLRKGCIHLTMAMPQADFILKAVLGTTCTQTWDYNKHQETHISAQSTIMMN